MKQTDIVEHGVYRALHHVRKYPARYRVDAIITIPSQTLTKTRASYNQGRRVPSRTIQTRSKVIYKVTCLDDGLTTAFRTHTKFIVRVK